jgi:hypothetical protein
MVVMVVVVVVVTNRWDACMACLAFALLEAAKALLNPLDKKEEEEEDDKLLLSRSLSLSMSPNSAARSARTLVKPVSCNH